jgi:hypothetical protein
LESNAQGEPEDAQVAAVIKEMGAPKEIAASYNPMQEYFIGPTLYPLFKRVIGIVFTAVVSAQLLVILFSLIFTGEAVNFSAELWNILERLPAIFGFVVAAFWGLQRLDLQPDERQFDVAGEFDPYKLPPLDSLPEPVGRGKKGFEILVSVMALSFLAHFVQQGGFALGEGGGLFANPILERLFPWVALSMLAAIMLDIVLLWQGRWHRSTRIAAIVSNLLCLTVLVLLILGHQRWLAAAGFPGLFDTLVLMPEMFESGLQVVGMVAFRMIFIVAAVFVGIETVVHSVRMFRSEMRDRPSHLSVSNASDSSATQSDQQGSQAA